MSFNPIGFFEPGAPLLEEAVAAARAFVPQLPTVPGGSINREYLHWEVEPWDDADPAYNGVVVLRDGKWQMVLSHDPRDQVAGLNDNAPASHTWHRNTGAVGLAIAGMSGASTTDFGPYPVQVHQLEYLCAMAAAFAVKYGIDTAGTVPPPGSNHADDDGNNVNTTGEHTILTHGECAVIDAYPDERWDLASFVPLPAGLSLTTQMRSQCGDALRERIHLYAAALKA
jgi:hypothetical protein